MSIRLQTDSTEETIALGRVLGGVLGAGDCVVLCGDLGAGKTHLTKGIAAGLGISDQITSPTFNIVYEYPSGRIPLYHFDLYRLEQSEQLDDIAYWELIEGRGASVLEWGDRFPDYLPVDYLQITIGIADENRRSLDVEGHGARGEQLEEEFAAASRALI